MSRGRKWFDGKNEEKVVAKLKYVWAIGGSEEEARCYAEISKDSFYRYLKIHPELEEIRERFKEKPILKARKRVVQGIGESYDNAMDYLSRKRKSEFGKEEDNSSIIPVIVMPVEIIQKYELNSSSESDSEEHLSIQSRQLRSARREDYTFSDGNVGESNKSK